MGASLVYLEKPNKDIQFDLGENANLRYAAAGMQGWRINMVGTSNLEKKILKKENLFVCRNKWSLSEFYPLIKNSRHSFKDNIWE